jgi:Mrp family chromosome partitioning ATPase/capsular polysaccharide biosynthesis protein
VRDDGETPAKVLAPLWARKWLILAAALVVAVATYVYYDRKPPIYQSQTTVLLGTSKLEEIMLGEVTPPSERILNNQAALLMSARYSEAVRQRLERQGVRQIPPFSVGVTPGAESDFLSIEARSSSPEVAAHAANALARELISERNHDARSAYEAAARATREQASRVGGSDLASTRERDQLLKRAVELETIGAVSQPDARQVDLAFPAAEPQSPRPLRNAVFGFVLGLSLASGIVLLIARMDRRIRSLSDLERLFNRPILATIPRLRRPLRPAVRGPEPADGVREPLRRVLTTLQLDRPDIHTERGPAREARRILITSAQSGEGKSVIAANLALVARELGARAALIDADRDAPTLSRLLGVGAIPGLSDVHAARVPIEDAWQRVDVMTEREPVAARTNGPATGLAAPAGEVMVLASGSRDAGSVDTGGEAVSSVLNWGDQRFDYAIIDSPPPLAVSDALPLLSTVDAVIVVARLGQTKVAAAERLVELMERLPTVPFVGVIANEVLDEERDAFGFVSYPRSSR